MGHHQKWVSDFKLANTDAGVLEHEGICKYFQALCCHDQCDGSNLSSCEMLLRRLQMIEEKYRDRAKGSDNLDLDDISCISASASRVGTFACALPCRNGPRSSCRRRPPC